jgi:hypothetical protein
MVALSTAAIISALDPVDAGFGGRRISGEKSRDLSCPGQARRERCGAVVLVELVHVPDRDAGAGQIFRWRYAAVDFHPVDGALVDGIARDSLSVVVLTGTLGGLVTMVKDLQVRLLLRKFYF